MAYCSGSISAEKPERDHAGCATREKGVFLGIVAFRQGTREEQHMCFPDVLLEGNIVVAVILLIDLLVQLSQDGWLGSFAEAVFLGKQLCALEAGLWWEMQTNIGC